MEDLCNIIPAPHWIDLAQNSPLQIYDFFERELKMEPCNHVTPNVTVNIEDTQASDMEKTFKHVCKICPYQTDRKYNYERHMGTKKHKDNVLEKAQNNPAQIHDVFDREPTMEPWNHVTPNVTVNIEDTQASDMEKTFKHVCKICPYQTDRKYNYERHMGTKKHKDNVLEKAQNNPAQIHDVFEREPTMEPWNHVTPNVTVNIEDTQASDMGKTFKHVCKICPYQTDRKYNYERHMGTKKHKDNVLEKAQNNPAQIHDVFEREPTMEPCNHVTPNVTVNIEDTQASDMEKSFKHVCKICPYQTDDQSNYARHMGTKKHKDNVLEKAQNNPAQIHNVFEREPTMEPCNHVTPNMTVNIEDTQASDMEKTFKHVCNCPYQTDDQSNYARHMKTKKHTNNVLVRGQSNQIPTEKTIPKQNKEDFGEHIELLEELYTSTINKYKEKCKTQEILISEQATQLSSMKKQLETLTYKINDLELEKNKINGHLNIIKEQLQTIRNMDAEVAQNTNIQKIKTNIKVFCRVRLRTSKEIEQMKALCSIDFIDEYTIEIGKHKSIAVRCSEQLHKFLFNKVFAATASQEKMFEELSLLVQSALEGYNVCVFAYGQTGSGKTFTMEGESELQTEGMIPRTVCHIFKEMKQFELLGWEYRIEASCLEIWNNDRIIDLLDSQPKSHEIRMVDSKDDLYVTNMSLRVKEINNTEELVECLQIAKYNQAIAATESNEQ
ncbi:unnamed protein product [Lasius platythorax]|uniref:Kinesin motor domain-containing protein n=1 Tax=Lasius platythorax TaxID=488582 RepID=A0AAV2MZ82_9HYME